MKIVVVSGGFDPVHSGHISLFRAAAGLGHRLIAGINSDEWLTRKKGKPFMPIQERKCVLNSIRFIDEVWEFDDSDNTACDLLLEVQKYYGSHTIIFANGGDRNQTNNAEINVPGIQHFYGVGGSDKMNSSSIILKKWTT
jgi:D-beta-D-heptose 7-phosphate kinase/D-beta-D-heptose 1-phosphate adenosyltransferase